jgi:hypothetical protein
MAIGILDRLDDAINPIVVKELRQAVKSRLVVNTLLLFLLLEVVILAVFLMFQEIRTPEGANAQAGQTMFLTLQGIMLGACMLLVPAYTAVRLAAERSDTNVDLLFISTLKPRSIILGKFLAAGVLVLLIFSACAPFMTFTYLLRGIDIPTILMVLALDFLVVMAATMLSVFLACVPANLILKAVLLLIGLAGLVAIFGYAMAASVFLVEEGYLLRVRPEVFWGLALGVGAAILTQTGQFFVWAVALINPPSANRALLVRLYTTALCLVTFAAAVGVAYAVKHPGPIYIWQGWMLALFLIHMTIGISEREQLGPRVARTIPRNGTLRVLAFLFYSGAAGGILFSVLLGTFVLIAAPVTIRLMNARFLASGLPSSHDPWHPAFVMTVIALYIYSFSLLGVLIRRLLLRNRLRTGFTWLLSLIAFAVGCAVPYLFILTIPQNSVQFERDHKWLTLTNPIAAAFAAGDPTGYATQAGFDDVVLGFVTVCAAGLTLCCLPWALRQIENFRPPKHKAAVPAAPQPEPVPVPVSLPLVETLGNGERPPAPPEAVTEPGPVQRARVE